MQPESIVGLWQLLDVFRAKVEPSRKAIRSIATNGEPYRFPVMCLGLHVMKLYLVTGSGVLLPRVALLMIGLAHNPALRTHPNVR